MKIYFNVLLTVIIAFIVLQGCIAFKDVDQYWEKAKLDPLLQGEWKAAGIAEPSQNKYLIFCKDGDNYRIKNRSVKEFGEIKLFPNDRAKSIKFGTHWFLIIKPVSFSTIRKMLKDWENDGQFPTDDEMNEIFRTAAKAEKRGVLRRYVVEGNNLTFFYIKEKVIWDAIKNKNLKGILPKRDEKNVSDMSPPAIDTLDETSIKFLIKIADDEDSWEERKTVYNKIKSAVEDIKKSSKYPSSESTDSNRVVLVDLPELKYLAEIKENLLLRHLKASPEWKVFYDGDDLVAYRRGQSGDGWTVSLNGFQSNSGSFDDKYRWQIRHLFRFSENGGGAFVNKYNQSKTTLTAPTAGKIKLKLESSAQGVESYFVVGQKGLYYEFFEQRSTSQFPYKGFSKEQRDELEKRKHTRAALKWVKVFLAKVKEAEVEIKKNGFCKELMPKGGIKEGKARIEIKDGMQGGIFDVYAWVNPGVEGKVFLKIFNAKTGDRLSEDRLRVQIF
jgi:hypothetical protein